MSWGRSLSLGGREGPGGDTGDGCTVTRMPVAPLNYAPVSGSDATGASLLRQGKLTVSMMQPPLVLRVPHNCAFGVEQGSSAKATECTGWSPARVTVRACWGPAACMRGWLCGHRDRQGHLLAGQPGRGAGTGGLGVPPASPCPAPCPPQRRSAEEPAGIRSPEATPSTGNYKVPKEGPAAHGMDTRMRATPCTRV